jgi:hypothetical protein
MEGMGIPFVVITSKVKGIDKVTGWHEGIWRQEWIVY